MPPIAPPLFDPRYDARLVGPLVEAIIALVSAQQAAAFEWALPGLAPFKQIDRSVRVGITYPWLGVMPLRNESSESEERHYLKNQHSIILEMRCIHSDPNILAKNLYGYIRGMTNMMLSVSYAYWDSYLEPGNVTGMDIVETNYFLVRASREHEYELTAQLRALFQVIEP